MSEAKGTPMAYVFAALDGVNLSIRHGRVILRGGCSIGPVLAGRIEEMELAGRRFVVVTSPPVDGLRTSEVAVPPEEIAGIEAMSEGEVADYWAEHNPVAEARRNREFLAAMCYQEKPHDQEDTP